MWCECGWSTLGPYVISGGYRILKEWRNGVASYRRQYCDEQGDWCDYPGDATMPLRIEAALMELLD